MTLPRLRKHRPFSFSHSLILFLAGSLLTLVVSLRFLPSVWESFLSLSFTNYNGNRLFSSPETIPIDLVKSFDAILVLGGGRPLSIDHPPFYVEKRCDDAMEVLRRRLNVGVESNRIRVQPKTLPILCLSAGTAHMPQLLSTDGLPIWESTACASYIKNNSDANGLKLGNESIYVETSSYDTIGNAYFARTAHTDPRGWRKLLVVTNEFHMMRTQKIFDWIFSLGADRNDNYQVFYLESPNVGMDPDVVRARKEREASSAKSVDKLSRKYSGSLGDIHRFFTQDHALYAAEALVDRGRATDQENAVNDAVKKSYGL